MLLSVSKKPTSPPIGPDFSSVGVWWFLSQIFMPSWIDSDLSASVTGMLNWRAYSVQPVYLQGACKVGAGPIILAITDSCPSCSLNVPIDAFNQIADTALGNINVDFHQASFLLSQKRSLRFHRDALSILQTSCVKWHPALMWFHMEALYPIVTQRSIELQQVQWLSSDLDLRALWM